MAKASASFIPSLDWPGADNCDVLRLLLPWLYFSRLESVMLKDKGLLDSERASISKSFGEQRHNYQELAPPFENDMQPAVRGFVPGRFDICP